ncbi:MAG: hypothetical protein MUF21_05285 [Gemmatimonadaceae bacterium]|nr:hypothetical protein [Gemmatimonadaceae bacterium]
MLTSRTAPLLAESLANAPATDWLRWVGDDRGAASRPMVEAIAVLPVPDHEVAFVLVSTEAPDGGRRFRQLLVALDDDPALPDGSVIVAPRDGAATAVRALALAPVRRWLHDALLAGITIRAGAWEWQGTPEARGGAGVTAGGAESRWVHAHDVELARSAHTTLVVPVRADAELGVELELLRRLASHDGPRLVPLPQASARWVGPDGTRLPSVVLHDLPDAATALAARLGDRIRGALDGDTEAFEGGLTDARALGVLARELHAALGRPVAEGAGAVAMPASRRDVEAWTLEAGDALDALDRVAQGAAHPAQPVIATLRAHLPAIAAAAGRDPGLVHRIHGAFSVDTVCVLPDGTLRVVAFVAPPTAGRPSPWHDVASLVASLTTLAGNVAAQLGGDTAHRDAAWRWEREARRAALDGYGTGGGAAHALVALFEIPLVARAMARRLRESPGTAFIAVHALERLAKVAI